MSRWFEDTPVARPWDLGRHRFETSEATDFARRHEPRLLAGGASEPTAVSGWLVAFTGHRLMLEDMRRAADALVAAGDEPGEPGPAPGCERIGFERPVHVGEEVRYRRTILDKRLSRSRPGWGLVISLVEGIGEHDEVVYVGKSVGFLRCRTETVASGPQQ